MWRVHPMLDIKQPQAYIYVGKNISLYNFATWADKQTAASHIRRRLGSSLDLEIWTHTAKPCTRTNPSIGRPCHNNIVISKQSLDERWSLQGSTASHPWVYIFQKIVHMSSNHTLQRNVRSFRYGSLIPTKIENDEDDSQNTIQANYTTFLCQFNHSYVLDWSSWFSAVRQFESRWH